MLITGGALVSSGRHGALRTTRDVFAPEVWELLNDLFSFATSVAQGTGCRLRHQVHRRRHPRREQVNGDCRHHQPGCAWEFIQLGRHLERADMTTGILDAGAVALLQSAERARVNLGQIVWGATCRARSARSCPPPRGAGTGGGSGSGGLRRPSNFPARSASPSRQVSVDVCMILGGQGGRLPG